MLKNCICGTEIDYSNKYCDECNDEIKIKNKYKYKQYREYLSNNKEALDRQRFYCSKQWLAKRDEAVRKFNGLCVVCYMKDNERIYSDLVHHIYTVESYPAKKLELRNLCCVCASCHQTLHNKMNKSKENEEKVIDELLWLVKEWERKFC